MSLEQTPTEIVNSNAIRPPDGIPSQLETITSISALLALAPEWETLSRTLPLQSPFVTPSWNILWWQHLHASSVLIHDRLMVFALRDAQGQLRAIAPMMISIRPGLGSFGVKVLQFFGADPNITEIRGLICRPEHSDAALAILQAHLLRHMRNWDWIEWQGLNEAQARKLSTSGVTPAKARVISYLPLPSDWAILQSGLSRNMKEAIRKCFNTLKRAQHEAELQVIDHQAQPEQFARALETFFHLHKLRAASSKGVTHADVFQAQKKRRFISAYLQAEAPKEKVQIFQLSIRGNVVASRIGISHERQLYLYYSGYDTAWSTYSVMTTLVILSIRWAIDKGYEGVNLSTGLDYSKQRWQPQELILHNAIQLAPRPAARLLFNTYSHLRTYPLTALFSREK
jgi:CelD/BcsL family acetyltransferase involved in cellulose biosynthesis